MSDGEKAPVARNAAANRDIIAGGILTAAVLLFVGTGSSYFSAIVNTVSGMGGGTERTLGATLILNIALILFGWRRYRDLNREVNDRTEAEQRANFLAATDPLTGFMNRRAIMAEGSELIRAGQRDKRTTVLFLLDLDHFKNVNDVHGHAVGDAVLKVAAQRLENALPSSALIARIGGDEFVALFGYDQADAAQVDRIAEKLVEELSKPIVHDDLRVAVGASIGIANTDEGTQGIETLMRRADIAMYNSKSQGRSRYSWFDPAMEKAIKARNTIETGIRSGLPNGEFVPYFEQQIDLSTGRLVGFEMLMRWDSPMHGLVSPDVFIPVAEDSGLISDLSMSVIAAAMHHANQWDSGLTLAVNVSPVQLKDPWFAQKMTKLLVETGFPASRLEVEITESSLFENLALVQSIIASLKNQGIRLSLDDFGTGYSSLSHLRALPFDRIKIDRSFVAAMTDSEDAAAIVVAIARLGESLNMPITAEGVEDVETERALIQLGCAKAQGWHYGKPMSPAATRRMLAERNLLASGRAAPVEGGGMTASAIDDIQHELSKTLRRRA